MNKKLFITCFIVFLLALTGGLLMFEPKVYASEIPDGLPTALSSYWGNYNVIIKYTNNSGKETYVFQSNYYTFRPGFKSGSSYIGFLGNPVKNGYLLESKNQDFTDSLRLHYNNVSYSGITNANYTSSFISNIRSIEILYCDFDNEYTFNNDSGSSQLNTNTYPVYKLDIVNNYKVQVPDDKNIIPDIPNENNIKYVVYWVGGEMKLCTFTQPTPIYVDDNDICYWWFRGTTTYSIYDCYWDYDLNNYAWDLLKTETFNGVSDTTTIKEQIGTYPDDFEYLKSNYDLEIYNSNKQLIDKEIVNNPTQPVVPSDKDPDIPATKFEPDMLPQSLKDKLNLDEDINFNEYLYWFYYSVGSNAMSMVASTQPLRYFDNLNPNMSDLYVRTQDQLSNIKVKVINWNTNDDFIQVLDKTLISSNYWVTQDTIVHNDFSSNYFSNYNIFNAVLDYNTYNWVLDDENVAIKQNITWSGGEYKDPDDPNGTSGDIWNTIKSYISSWFIPKTDYSDKFYKLFTNRFQINQYINEIKKLLPDENYTNTDTDFLTIDFTNKNYHGMTGKYNLIDISWYAPYKETGDRYISIFLYITTILAIVRIITKTNILPSGKD